VSTTEQQKTSETTREIVYLTYDKASSSLISSELEKAGYRTTLTSSIGETILCLRQPKFLALIIGPLVQPKDKALLVSELRRKNSKTKVVFLSRDGTQQADDRRLADAVLSVHNGADSLIRGLKKLMIAN
jgi:DNA-binding response OmpR family regulator